jgi:hypothetical protein
MAKVHKPGSPSFCITHPSWLDDVVTNCHKAVLRGDKSPLKCFGAALAFAYISMPDSTGKMEAL